MADNIDRTHVYNVMDWLEAEQDEKNKQSRVSELAAEIAVLRRDEVKRHTIALDEMYGAVVRTGHSSAPNYGIRVCHMAKAMVFLPSDTMVGSYALRSMISPLRLPPISW